MTAPASQPAFRKVDAGLLTIEASDQPGRCEIRVSGELDLASAAALDHELQRALASEVDAIVLDLADLTFVDSMGLQCLVRAAQIAKGTNRLRAVNVQGEPRRIFRLTALDVILPVAEPA